MIPVSVLFLLASLIGWPLLKLSGALLSRPKWKEFKHLHQMLQREEWYSPAIRKLVDHQRMEGFGGGMNILAPIIVPTGVLVQTVRAWAGSKPLIGLSGLKTELANRWAADFDIDARSPLFQDRRFWRMAELSTDLALLRDPVSGILTSLAVVVMLPILAMGYGAVVFRTSFGQGFETLLMLVTSQTSAAHKLARR